MKNKKLYRASIVKYLVSVLKTGCFLIFPGIVFAFALSLGFSNEYNISINNFFNIDNFLSSVVTLSTTPLLFMIVIISSLIIPLFLYPLKIGLSDDHIEIGARVFGLRPVKWDSIDRIERSGCNKVTLYYANSEEMETVTLSLFMNKSAADIISYTENIMKRKIG